MAIDKFKSGNWYRWAGEKKRHWSWNDEGEMDFILDGKPHQCKEGAGWYAAFFDSPRPKYMWCWRKNLMFFEEVQEVKGTK